MATLFIFLLLLTVTTNSLSDHTTTSLYLSPKTTFSNYNNMLHSFKIFTYPPPPSTKTPLFTTTQESKFYNSLIRSHFITDDPTTAHLFFLPFPSSTSTRNLARLIRTIRVNFPFWNRTLGADHFHLSATGVAPSSDRNIVELKKNSIQISCFPTSSGLFIPHKDITLPPVHSFEPLHKPPQTVFNSTNTFLGYMKVTEFDQYDHADRTLVTFIKEIKNDSDFLIEHDSANEKANTMNCRYTKVKMMKSRFCLFVYGYDMRWMVEAMGLRCVPVVITDRPIQDLPLMDVIEWSEIAVFVSLRDGVKGLKRVLDGIEESEYEKNVESGVVAVQHLRWNAEPEAYDAFHMVVYQLWLRRHTIRYARWVEQ